MTTSVFNNLGKCYTGSTNHPTQQRECLICLSIMDGRLLVEYDQSGVFVKDYLNFKSKLIGEWKETSGGKHEK